MKSITKGTLATIALAATMSALVAGCGPSQGTSTQNAASSDQPVDGGTMTIGQATKFNPLFIPAMDGGLYTANIVSAAFDPLLTYDKKLQFVPDLAKSWTWSDDKKTLTMTLADAKWSDGQPITSDDILFTLNYLASKEYTTTLQGVYSYLVGSIVGADKIGKGDAKSFADTGGFKKIDDKNFSLTFGEVDAAVLWSQISSIQPIPEHTLKQYPLKDWQTIDYDKMPTVVSGAFKFVSVTGSDSVQMAPNEQYFQGKPHIGSLVWKTVSADVAPGLLANGSLDMMLNGLNPIDVSKLKNIPNVLVQTPPQMGYQYLGFKLYQKEFQDVRVRQAFMYGINRQAMVDGLLKGLGKTISGPLSDVSWAAASTADGLNDYKYDPDKAGQLLDAAGWKKGPDGFRIDPVTGKTANIALDYPLGNTVRMASAEAIKEDLAKIGLKINVHPPMDFNALSKKVESDDKTVYLWLMGWSLSLDPDPRGMWGSKDAYNYPRWSDAHNEDLIKATYNAAAFDLAQRKKALVDWQLYVNQQVPYAFLYQPDEVFAYTKRVHIPDKDWTVLGPINFQDWWVK